MSERVRRLAESEAFQLAPVAYSILDPDGRQLAANPAFLSVFRSDRPGLRAEEMTHETDRELTASYLTDLLSGASDRVVVDKRYLRGDGTTFWGRLTATAVRDDDGNPEFLIGMIDDITSQHDALSAVQAASEAKSGFVARVSHDLRTPLHAIRGLAELLTLAELDPAARGFAEAIRTEADKLRGARRRPPRPLPAGSGTRRAQSRRLPARRRTCAVPSTSFAVAPTPRASSWRRPSTRRSIVTSGAMVNASARCS